MNISGTTAIAVERDALIKEVDRLRVQCAALRSALDRAEAAIWDAHYGRGIDVEYARAVTREIKAALALGTGKGYVPADAISDEELGEFQNEVRDLVIELSGAPSDLIDGKGSDAGWQEFTLAEIAQGFAYLKDNTVPAGKARVIAEALELAVELLPQRCRRLPIQAGIATSSELGLLNKNPS